MEQVWRTQRIILLGNPRSGGAIVVGQNKRQLSLCSNKHWSSSRCADITGVCQEIKMDNLILITITYWRRRINWRIGLQTNRRSQTHQQHTGLEDYLHAFGMLVYRSIMSKIFSLCWFKVLLLSIESNQLMETKEVNTRKSWSRSKEEEKNVPVEYFILFSLKKW